MEKNKQPKEQNKLLFFEPNSENNSFTSTEDLSIFAELETTSKGRSIININTFNGETNINNRGGGINKTISFIKGDEKNYNNSLTTSYTDISSLNNEGSRESLGIENISIDFDTAYTPMIKIKFVDLRGDSILGKGNESDYSFFFDLPYPIFSLTIKGYYGRPVNYCLHLLKWNGKFNASTGNFEIETEFIGYTYAILTDLLLGFIRAVVDTEIGKPIYDKIKKDFESNNSGVELKTIDEFLKDVETISDEFNKIKNEDTLVKELGTSSKIKNNINNVRNRLKNIDSLIKPKDSDYFSNESGIIVISPNQYTKVKKEKIKLSWKEEIVKLFDDPDSGLNLQIDINELKIQTKKIWDYKVIEDLNFKDFNDDNSDNSGNNNSSKLSDEILEVLDLYVKKNSDEPFVLIDLTEAYEELSRVEKALIDNEKTLRTKIGEKLSSISNKQFGFKPSIRNILRILSVHCEVFLKTMHEVSKNAENNERRAKILNKIFNNDGESFNLKDSNKFYPWPEFRKKKFKNGKTSSYVESWIGSEGGVEKLIDQNNIDEIVFVEDLLDKLLNITRKDITSEIRNQEAKGPQFYPTSTIDTVFSKNTLINPYKKALLDKKNSARPEEATRCLMTRAFLIMGVANKNYNDVLVKLSGELEAQNLFEVINKDFSNEKASNFLNRLNGNGTAVEKTNKLISEWKVGYNNTILKNPYNEARPMLRDSNDKKEYIYTYITDKTAVLIGVEENQGKSIIPVSGNYDGEGFWEDKNLKSNSDLLDLSSSVDFISNNFGTSKNKLDNIYNELDGSNYISIIDSKVYDESGLNTPTYGSDDIKNTFNSGTYYNNLHQSELLYPTYNDTSIVKIFPYNTKYNCLEFFDIIYDGKKNFYGENVIYNKEGKKENLEGSVLSAYWVQRSEYINRGTVLATTNIDTSKTETSVNYGGNYVSAKDINTLDIDNYGKQRELIGTIIGEFSVNQNENDEQKTYVPFIEYGVNNDKTPLQSVFKGSSTFYYSLFGSLFYYQQKNILSKSFLFLHSLPWQGLSGDKDEVNIFDKIGDNGSDDDTFTIKSLFRNNSAFVKVPKLWCAFIGAILYRYQEFIINGNDIINFNKDDNGNFLKLFPFQNEESLTPDYDYFLYNSYGQNDYSMNFFFDSKDFIVNDKDPEFIKKTYKKIDETILNLPAQVKDEFITSFKNFTETDFIDIDKELRLLDDYSYENYKGLWTSLESKKVSEENISYGYKTTIKKSDIVNIINSKPYVNKNLINIYGKIMSISDLEVGDGDTYPISLEMTYNSKVNKRLTNLFSEYNVIKNNSPLNFSNDDAFDTKYKNISVNVDKFKLFLQSFYIKFDKLVEGFNKNEDIRDDYLEQKIFKTSNSELIKLNIYRSLSSIYNKWIGDVDDVLCQCGVSGKDIKISENQRGSTSSNLIDSFRFIDRAFNDIGDDFLINPTTVSSLIKGNYNQSFFDITNKILTDNNFNFIALPNFLNFNKVSQLKEMFTAYPYNDIANEEFESGPSFVCSYIGQTSTNLDLGKNSQYSNDGIIISDEDNLVGLPPDFTKSSDNPNDLNIPMISVSYGKGNQSIFKDIKLDQSEFSETAETLEVIEDISQSGDKRKPTSAGQNLFNVYQTRSYSTEIEMMGNAMMQPMMYFYLKNIPMFRGAYMILKVSHEIKANSMTTKFKGVRVKYVATDLIDSSELFTNLLGTLSSSGSNIGSNKFTKNKLNTLSDDIIFKVGDTLGIRRKGNNDKEKKEVDDWALEEVGNFIYELGKQWSELAKQKGGNYPKELIYTDISKEFGARDIQHATHDNGMAIDFRMFNKIPSKYKTGGVKIGNDNYSREITRAFIALVKKISDNYKKDWVGRKPIRNILINDTVLKNEFNVLVRLEKNHNDHIHISFNLPNVYDEQVKKEKAERADDGRVPVENGLVIKLNDNEKPKNSLDYLGQL